jgi:hypothetical protein
VGLTITNTEGVTLEAETVIGANITATKVTVKSDGTNGTVIKSDGDDLTVATDNTIEATATGAKIVVGTTAANQITITGSVLGEGAYTGTDGKLSLAAGEITVGDGGVITIEGAGNLEFTVAASTVILSAGGAIDVKAATGKFGEASQTDTKITVTGTEGKAEVVKDGTTWTVTDDGTGTDISTTGKIILGTLTLGFNGTSAVNNAAGADAALNAAAGKLIAGPDTTITFIGTD